MNNAAETTTDVADLCFAIARLEDQAQNAEDRGQEGKAGKIRAQVRSLRAQLPVRS